jgi:C-terminal processing protease CtpA/Prc
MDNAPVSLDSTIGYVNVPALGDHTQESIKTYITGVQQEIKAADNTAVKGWIVDLRGNTGGYSRPMLQAIRPILGEGIVGYMLSPDGSSYPWDYEQTYSFVDAYKLKRPAPKVAVLMNGTTASAGELIAIAFTGRPQTKSFGTATRGVSTGRAVFDINGEKLSLAINVMADRTMKPYGKKVYPDVEEKNAELVIAKAVQWLNQ